MKAVLLVLLVATAGISTIAAAPTASAACYIGTHPVRDAIVCVPIAGPLAWDVVCGQQNVCP